MNKLFYNAVIKYAGAGSLPDEVSDEGARINSLITNIVSILLWGFSVVGVIFCIGIGFKFAMAKTPEDKKACKDRLIWFIIGTAIVLGASVIWTVIQNVVDIRLVD